MSKDKGTKNHKKPKADKSSGKVKPISDYKAEGKGGFSKLPTSEPLIVKDTKGGSGNKPKKG